MTGLSDPPDLTELESEILRLCGLSALLGPGLLRRALADAGASSPPTAKDLLNALPKRESRMLAYLPATEVRDRSARIRRLLAAAE